MKDYYKRIKFSLSSFIKVTQAGGVNYDIWMARKNFKD
jgi:hypothetical protein